MFSLVLACFAVMFLSGCTPEYNWRETIVAQQRAEIAFPAKTQSEKRDLVFDGYTMQFSLVSAHVGPSVFAVGSVELPATMTSTQIDTFLAMVTQGLARQAGGTSQANPHPGEVFEIDGIVAGQSSRLWAKVLVHKGMLMQITASGPAERLKAEQALTFMQSLRLK